MKGKKSEKSVVKSPRNPVLNVVVTLQQRCGNVFVTLESDVVTKSETTSVQVSFSSVSQLCDNVNNDVVTTLSQPHSATWEKYASVRSKNSA